MGQTTETIMGRENKKQMITCFEAREGQGLGELDAAFLGRGEAGHVTDEQKADHGGPQHAHLVDVFVIVLLLLLLVVVAAAAAAAAAVVARCVEAYLGVEGGPGKQGIGAWTENERIPSP